MAGVRPNLSVIGSTGLRSSGGVILEEFHPKLRGRQGAKVFREMRDNDAIVGAYFAAIEALIRQVPWEVEEASDTAKAKAEAEFLREVIGDMNQPFEDVVSEIMSMLVFGWCLLELCYKVRRGDKGETGKSSRYDDGRIGWRKLETRSQETLDHWEFDEDGGIRGMWQNVLTTDGTSGMFFIPIEKALLFRTTMHANNPEGRSLLRNAYRSWWMCKRFQEIEAIGHERNLNGMPVMKVPPQIMSTSPASAVAAQRADFEKLVQEVRVDARMGIVIPASVDPDTGQPTGYDFQLLSGGAKDLQATGLAIQRYEYAIASTVNANFILMGRDSGGYAIDKNKTEFFIMTLSAILNSIGAVFNQYAIPRLMKMNGVAPKYWPTIRHGEILQESVNDIADYLTKLSGFITPDVGLEAAIRRRANMPQVDEEPQLIATASAAWAKHPSAFKLKESLAALQQGPVNPADDIKPGAANADTESEEE